MQTPWSVNAASRIALLLESSRPPAREEFTTLTQSLYARASLASEAQIALLMREPNASIRFLLARNRLHNLNFERKRNIVGEGRRVRRYCEAFRIEQRQEYLDLIRADSRSRIVASFHFGDFLYGCASLFSLDSPARRKLVLSLNESVEASYTNLATGFGSSAPGSECELILNRCSSAQLSQLLREGNTTLLLFCDVPPGLVETIDVSFLGRRGLFPVGPALLALANRVPLLPLMNYSHGGSNYLRLGRQVEPILLESESLRAGARRITQDLVCFFEEFFQEYPEQWRFVALLPLYFPQLNQPCLEH